MIKITSGSTSSNKLIDVTTSCPE